MKAKQYDMVENLLKEGYFSIEEREIITYGIRQGKSLVLSVIGTLLLGIAFKVPIAAIIFLVTFIPLRKYAGGYHANTQLKCTIISFISISCCFYLISKAVMTYVIFLCVIASFFIIFILAPMQNSKKYLDEKEIIVFKKATRKILYIQIFCFMVSILLNLHIVTYAITSSLFLVSISLLAGLVKEILQRTKKI